MRTSVVSITLIVVLRNIYFWVEPEVWKPGQEFLAGGIRCGHVCTTAAPYALNALTLFIQSEEVIIPFSKIDFAVGFWLSAKLEEH